MNVGYMIEYIVGLISLPSGHQSSGCGGVLLGVDKVKQVLERR